MEGFFYGIDSYFLVELVLPAIDNNLICILN